MLSKLTVYRMNQPSTSHLIRDLLFEAGGKLLSGLGRLLRATPKLQGLHSVEQAPDISWPDRLQTAHSHKTSIDVNGPLLHAEMRPGDDILLSFKGRKD